MSKGPAGEFARIKVLRLTGGRQEGMMIAPQVGWTVAAPRFGARSRKVRTP